MRSLTSALLVLLVASAPALAQDAHEYRIGSKDLLAIQVAEDSSFNVQRRVDGEGTISLPLLDRLPVAGMTVQEAAQAVRDALEESLLQRATVAVEVKEYRSRPISVLGAVNKPGPLQLSGRINLLQAIAEAGGLSNDHGEFVRVTRRSDNGLEDRLTIDLEELTLQADPIVNLPIQANDVIYVEALEEITVLFIGEVGRAGALTLKSNDRHTLLTAIARMGGLTDRASSKIRIKRTGSDGRLVEFRADYKAILRGADPDVELQDGDLIVVKEAFF